MSTTGIATARHTYAHPRAALTADWVVRTIRDGRACVLLIRRLSEPFVGSWALPGGHIEPGETVERGAARELVEETGLIVADARLVDVYSDPERDPRGWVVSIAYTASVGPDAAACAVAGDDASEVGWFPLDALPPLAFDHAQIIAAATGARA